ncbi:MAG: glycosyltransferase [Flavobacteriales bacterium]|nr:glycosyltransferase [Flavobacteriales bacterium]
MTPKVSIVLTCYNLGAYLQEALDSIAAYPEKRDYEVIIVDDGSTDPATVAVLDGLDPAAYVLLRQANMGLGQARNNGISMARGTYIIPFDADNRLRPAMIAQTIAVLDSTPDVDVVYGDAEYFGERSGRFAMGPHGLEFLLERNRIDACAGFRKELWQRLGGYDWMMPVMGYEDWDFWLRAGVAGASFHKVPEILFNYRVRGGSMIKEAALHLDQVTAYIFNKPELRNLAGVRNTLQALRAKAKAIPNYTGRDHLRLMLQLLVKRINPIKARP